MSIRAPRVCLAIGLAGARGSSCGSERGPISAEVATILAAKYPQDQATGYVAGDLRGIFSIEKRVE